MLFLYILAYVYISFTSAYLNKGHRRSLSSHTRWLVNRVPASYDAVESLLVDSLKTSLPKISSSDQKKFFIEVRTPGLNDKIEQSAIVSKDLLFDLCKTMINPILQSYPFAKFMFPSSGDAAGFQAYCSRRQINIPSTIILTDIATDRVTPEDRCLLLIGARNNVGDPVIRTVQQITDANPLATCILVNCDLSDRVTTGMTSRTLRDNYRASFQPLFYFRNLVTIMRPSQVPLERGALMYTPSDGWTVYAVDQSRIVGPGSLNRFMRTAAFYRSKGDPTASDPPEFMLAGSYTDMPKRDEIDETLTRAAVKLERMLERRRRARSFSDGAEALSYLKQCIESRSFDKADDIEEAMACLQRSPVKASMLSPSMVGTPLTVLDTSQQMGVVNINLQEIPESSKVINADDVKADGYYYPWEEATISAILGNWKKAHGNGASVLGEILDIYQNEDHSIDVTIKGRSQRRGRLVRNNQNEPARMYLELEAQSLFGMFTTAEAETEELRLLHVDQSMCVLQEVGSDALSLWSRA